MNGELIFVTAVSKRGKQLVKEHGSYWSLDGGPVPMQCFDGDAGVRIVALDGSLYTRNIRKDNDKVFSWNYVDESEWMK